MRRVRPRTHRRVGACAHPNACRLGACAPRPNGKPHERTMMGWPCRLELWGETIDQARADYAAVANAIAAFEPVTMIANPGEDAARARAACGEGVEIVELPLDDSWLRDCGPIYVLRRRRPSRIAVHFGFNAWGEKFPPWDRDAAVGGLIAEQLGDEVRDGADGARGRVDPHRRRRARCSRPSSACCNPNRNPSLSRERDRGGAARAARGGRGSCGSGRGCVEDRDTDGHVDLIAAFIRARPRAAADRRGRTTRTSITARRTAPGCEEAGIDRDRAPVSALRHGRRRDRSRPAT